jgi:hypothetical protein
MKNIILFIFLSLFSLVSFSQKTVDTNIVIHNECVYVDFDKLKILTIENPLVGFIVFPMNEPTTFYLINYENKIVKWGENTKTPSFDSEDLQSGIYYLMLETPTSKEIYKLIK